MLFQEKSKQKKPPLENTVLLKSTVGEVELALIRGILDEENIPYLIKHCGSSSYLRFVTGYSIYGSDIYVEKDNFERATSLVKAYCQTQEETEEEVMHEEISDEDMTEEVDDEELARQAESADTSEENTPSTFSTKTLIIMIVVAIILLVCVKLVGGLRA